MTSAAGMAHAATRPPAHSGRTDVTASPILSQAPIWSKGVGDLYDTGAESFDVGHRVSGLRHVVQNVESP